MRPFIRKSLQFVLFLGTGVLILFLVFRSQSNAYRQDCELRGLDPSQCDLIDKLVLDFQQADFLWVGVVYLLFILSNVSRAIRWSMLIEPLGKKVRFSTAFLSIMIGYFTNLGFPRIGELVRAGAVSRYEGIKMEKVIGTVVVDRIVDLLSLAICVAIAAITQWDKLFGFLSEYVSLEFNLIGIIKIVSLLLVLAGAVFLTWYKRGYLSRFKLFDWLFSKLRGFADGLLSIRKVKKPFWFAFHSVMIWVCYYFMTYFGLWVFGPTSNLGHDAGLVTFIFGAFGFVIPSPGGMGTYHFLVMEALEIYGVSSVDGFSFANILFFAIQIGCNIIFGILALLALPLLHRRRLKKNGTS